MTDATVTAASAADMNEADALAAFGQLADAHESGDPVAVESAEPETETPAAPAADEVPTQTAAAPAAATDIWANATPELRAAHEAELAQRDQKYRSDIGRQAAHQREIQSLRDQLAGRAATPAAATAEPAATTPSLREAPAMRKAVEDYPEVVGPILDAFEPVIAENQRLSREMSVLTEDRRAVVQSAQETALTAAHPDWRAACGSKDFSDWLEAQPASIKKIVAENGESVVNAEDAIAMVGNFKAHWHLTHPKPIPQPVIPTPAPTNLADRRAAQLNAVTTTPRGAPSGIPDGVAGGGDKAMFDHYAAKKAQGK